MEVRRGLVPLWVLLALVATGGAAAANQPPVAEAGLDQRVGQNVTVYLDAGGSYDPDGEVASYDWTVTAPNGSTVEPDCSTCVRARFRASQTGEYEVTVTVTDEAGATTSDTLYVEVVDREPPRVRLTGPESLDEGAVGTVTADVTAGDGPLSRVTWVLDGSEVATRELNGSGTYTWAGLFGESGSHTVTAKVTDIFGQTATASHTIRVTEAATTRAGSGGRASRSGWRRSRGGHASTDYVTATSGPIRSYSDLILMNVADGTTAITIETTSGEVTLVNQETVQRYIGNTNWYTITLEKLVKNRLVEKALAEAILEKAQKNKKTKGTGAVGTISSSKDQNSYDKPETRDDINKPDSSSDKVHKTHLDESESSFGQGPDLSWHLGTGSHRDSTSDSKVGSRYSDSTGDSSSKNVSQSPPVDSSETAESLPSSSKNNNLDLI